MYSSETKFTLPPSFLKNNISELTEIQNLTLIYFESKLNTGEFKDLAICSETGSGKTLGKCFN